MEENNNEKELTPSEYFEVIKNAKQVVETESLKKSYAGFIKLAEKYSKLGQKESLKKLCFLADTLIKEEKLIEMGIDTFIYRDVIEDFIVNVNDDAVKIVELQRYMREIPDELVDVVENTKDIFDAFYVLFTDYTGIEERKVEKERRDKDPILFGAFKNGTNVADRFYYLGDWVDEYCDLTLDKLVAKYEKAKGYSPVIVESIPETAEDLVELMKTFRADDDRTTLVDYNIDATDIVASIADIPVPPYTRSNKFTAVKSIIDKVRSVFKK